MSDIHIIPIEKWLDISSKRRGLTCLAFAVAVLNDYLKEVSDYQFPIHFSWREHMVKSLGGRHEITPLVKCDKQYANLVLFSLNDSAKHVAIYVGDDKILESPTYNTHSHIADCTSYSAYQSTHYKLSLININRGISCKQQMNI